MWTYHQKNGELLHDGAFQGTGYSGTGAGRNNPAQQSVPNVGPIPTAQYTIGPVYNHPLLGPCVMNLEPLPNEFVFHRDLFRIHGDNARNDASHGCIILGPSIRRLIADSGDHDLEVLP